MPESLLEPDGRGSAASDSMRLTIRRRSTFVPIASSSFNADFLIRILYLSTPFQILYDALKGIISLSFPNLEGLNISRVF